MDPEIKNLLEENIRLNKENHILLSKIWRIERWGQITRIFYWVIIIGFALGVFYYIKPFLGNFVNLYTGGVSNIGELRDMSKNLDIRGLQELLK